jgi:hypothetical protein
LYRGQNGQRDVKLFRAVAFDVPLFDLAVGVLRPELVNDDLRPLRAPMRKFRDKREFSVGRDFRDFDGAYERHGKDV